jgi:hypothetical protein
MILGIALLFSTTSIFAQEAITGNIPDWSLGEGEVIGGFKTPIIMGTVTADGTFAIPLKENYMNEVKLQIEQENRESTSGWTSSLLTLGRAFGCSSETLKSENADQPVSKVSTMGMFALGKMEEQKLYGYLLAASSENFAKSIKDYNNEFKTGYFVDWYYVDEPATIKGSCSMESYAINQEEMYTTTQEYDLVFQPGWNIIKYEIEAVFEDRDGKAYPEKERYTTLATVPADIKFIFMPDER